MTKLLLAALTFLTRLCLVPIGLAILALTFFDDTGYLLGTLITKISDTTFVPRILVAIPGIALWIALKGFFFITGPTTIVKVFRWRTAFWQIAMDITSGLDNTAPVPKTVSA